MGATVQKKDCKDPPKEVTGPTGSMSMTQETQPWKATGHGGKEDLMAGLNKQGYSLRDRMQDVAPLVCPSGDGEKAGPGFRNEHRDAI